jgi:hypothetical protein
MASSFGGALDPAQLIKASAGARVFDAQAEARPG